MLTAAIEAGLAQVHTALPGRIVRWDATKQQADVQPAIQRAYFDEEDARRVEKLPVLPCVPVVFPGGGGYRITFPIAVGDTCLVVFSEQSLDKWLSGTGGDVDPGIDHGHALTDAICIPGLRPFGSVLSSCPTDEATIGKDTGKQIHLEAATITIGDKSGSDFVALAGKVLTELQAIQSAFSGHTHSGTTLVPTVGGVPGTIAGVTGLSSTYSPSSVAASQAKAK